MNRENNWFTLREELPNSLKALSQAIKSGIEIKPDEIKDNMLRIPLEDLSRDSRGLVLYGGWNGDEALRTQRANAHVEWLRKFEVAKKEGVRFFVPSDEIVNCVNKPIDTQIWSAGSDIGFNLEGSYGNLDDDYGVFGMLD